MKNIRSLAAGFVVALSLSGVSTAYAVPGGSIQNVTVTRINPTNSAVWIQISAGSVNISPSCASESLVIKMDQPNALLIFQTALSAFLSGRSVNIYTNPSTPSCALVGSTNYPVVKEISMF